MKRLLLIVSVLIYLASCEKNKRLIEVFVVSVDDSTIAFTDEKYQNLKKLLKARIQAVESTDVVFEDVGEKSFAIKLSKFSDSKLTFLKQLIETKARLSFHVVHEKNSSLVRNALGSANPSTVAGYELKRIGVESDSNQFVYMKAEPEPFGYDNVYSVRLRKENGRYIIIIRLTSEGKKLFTEITERLTGRCLAIVLDGQVYTAPFITRKITNGYISLSGNFDKRTAHKIKNVLSCAGLPLDISVTPSQSYPENSVE